MSVIQPLESRWILASGRGEELRQCKGLRQSDVATVWIMREAGLPLAHPLLRRSHRYTVSSSSARSATTAAFSIYIYVTLQIQPLIARSVQKSWERARTVLAGPEPDRDKIGTLRRPLCVRIKKLLEPEINPKARIGPIPTPPRTGKRLASEWAGEGIEDLLELEEADLVNPIHQKDSSVNEIRPAFP